MKLHLGSGNKKLSGFMSMDIEPHENVDFVGDIGVLAQFSDNSIKEIYCSHAVEYFDRFEVEDVFREWHRVLEIGGYLYISVPDFQSLIKIYSETKDLDKVIGPLFGRWLNTKNGNYIYHRTVWDFDSLFNKLKKTGFDNIAKFNPIDYLSQIDPEYDDYSLAYFPHMDRSGIQVSLAIKARKS